MVTSPIGPRLMALFATGVLLLNFPLLALWGRDTTVLGLPLFPLALFGIWAGLIALLAWLLERGGQGQPGQPEQPGEQGVPENRADRADRSGAAAGP